MSRLYKYSGNWANIIAHDFGLALIATGIFISGGYYLDKKVGENTAVKSVLTKDMTGVIKDVGEVSVVKEMADVKKEVFKDIVKEMADVRKDVGELKVLVAKEIADMKKEVLKDIGRLDSKLDRQFSTIMAFIAVERPPGGFS